MTQADARLHLAFGGHEWAWLRKRLRACLAREDRLPEYCARTEPSAEEWQAACDLLGRRTTLPGKVLRVPVTELESVLVRAEICTSLRDALVQLGGPIQSRPAAERREREAWHRVVKSLHELREHYRSVLPLEAHSDDAEADIATLKTLSGRDPAAAAQLIDSFRQVLATLNTQSGAIIHRAQLAAQATGDSHALDRSTPLFRLLAYTAGMSQAPYDAILTAWHMVADEVSSSALVLNLRFTGTPLAVAFDAFAEQGEPCRILLRHVVKLISALSPATDLYVCENPCIIETAARELGPDTSPILCTEGQPSVASQILLAAAGNRMERIHYHGDFDWGGIRIANYLHQVIPDLRPWRFRHTDYQAQEGGCPLSGTPVDACWDPELATAMSTRALAFHEENILPQLIADLRR